MLVKSKNLPQFLQDVYVEGVNTQIHDGSDSSEEERSRRGSEESDDEEEDSEEQDGQHRLLELKIQVYNHTVEFKKNRRVVVSTGRLFSINASSCSWKSVISQNVPHSFEDAQMGLVPSLGLSMCLWLDGVLHHRQN